MSDEGEKTCPICAEEMDLTDQQLKPCKCGYEICVWCWHHIMEMAEKDDTEGRCPACRNPYDKEKIVGTASKCERLVAEISMEKKKSHKAKSKTSEGRKQLTSVRVIQRNLVYIVGLPLNLADEDLLQRKEYFGQYGKVLKVSISRTSAGTIQQFANSTCSVYITYSKEEEAVRCIQSIHGFTLEGRTLRACFGTTKYCHAWLRNVPCTNPDCLYLHEIGSQEESFSKDENETISAYSRVQQITGLANSGQRYSGSVLPPPADDYCNNSPATTGKPIAKSTPNNLVSSAKVSPPTTSAGRTGALPAAASWGSRGSNCQSSVGGMVCSNELAKQKHDAVNGSLAFSASVSGFAHATVKSSDPGKKVILNDDIHPKEHTNKLKPPETKNQLATDLHSKLLVDSHTPVAVHTTPMAMSGQPPSLPISMDDSKINFVKEQSNIVGTENERNDSRINMVDSHTPLATDDKNKKLCHEAISVSNDLPNFSQNSRVSRPNGLSLDCFLDPRDHALEQSSNAKLQQMTSPSSKAPTSIAGATVLRSDSQSSALLMSAFPYLSMEAIYSPRAKSLSLIPRTSPSLCGISSIRVQFLARAHGLANSKLQSRRRRSSRKHINPSSRRNSAPALRIVASLNSGQILVVVVAAVSAFSFVYLNYFSRRKKLVQKESPLPASEHCEKHEDKVLTDLSIQDLTVDAFHEKNVKEIAQSVGDTRKEDFEKDANAFQYQFQGLETASINGDTQIINPLEWSGSLHSEQPAGTSWLLEGNGEVSLPLQIIVPEPDTVQLFASVIQVSEKESERCNNGNGKGFTEIDYMVDMRESSSDSTNDSEEDNTLKTSNGHIDHVSTEYNASPEDSVRGELHLFYDEDRSITSATHFLHGIPELYSEVSHQGGHHISASTSAYTTELLQEDNLPSGYSEQSEYLLSNKRSNANRRRDLVKGRETETCDNIGLVSYDNQHLSLSRVTNVLEKESPVKKLGSYHHLLRYGRLQECITLLEEMDLEGELDMNKVYHSRFLSLCRSQKAVNEAFRFVKLIPNPTLSTFNMLMSVCSSAQDADGAAKVWQLVQEGGFKADCKLYTTMISTYGKCGKVDAMFKVFHEMTNSGVEPNLHTYGALIDGCARSGQIAKAFGAYGILRSKKVKPDRVIFNALITACGHSGAVDRAFDVLREMRAEPHPTDPDHITIGALMKACTNVGQVDRVEEVYEMIEQYKIRGTAELYTIAVRSCSQTGDWTFACNIYNDMRKNGVEPDEMFLSALVDVAGHAGNIDAAFEVLQEATLEGMKLGIMPYSSLMGACCTTKSWRKALELYEEIKALGLVPTVTTMNALITALCEGNQLQKALEAFLEMKNMGLSPNDITYSILFVASEKNDDLDAGLMLLSQIKTDGLPLNMVMRKCLIGMCSRSVEKTAALGELSVSFKSGKPQIDSNWTSLAVIIYREATAASMVPSVEVLSEVLGCLQLPANISVRESLVELLGVDIETSRSESFYSLIDGFGEYDLRAFSLLEEAASMGIVPCVSFKGSPIVIDARKWPIHVAEVYLLTVLKGLKHRLAAGATLPTVSVLLPIEVKKVVSEKGEKTANVAGRVGQAIGAMLRRRGLPYQGNESYGKIRISGRSLRRWFQPKAVMSKQSEFSLSSPRLGKQIAEQRRNIRTETYTLY